MVQEHADKQTSPEQPANGIPQLRKELSEIIGGPCEFKSLAMILGSVLIPVLMAVFTLYGHFK